MLLALGTPLSERHSPLTRAHKTMVSCGVERVPGKHGAGGEKVNLVNWNVKVTMATEWEPTRSDRAGGQHVTQPYVPSHFKES